MAEAQDTRVQDVPRTPVGFEEWSKTGTFLGSLDIPLGKTFDAHGQVYGIEAVLSGWGGNISWLTAKRSKQKLPNGALGFEITVSYKKPVGKSAEAPPPWARTTQSSAWQFTEIYWHRNLAQSDIIPIFGQLYKISTVSNNVRLTNVTSQVPAEFRPRSKVSRTIETTERYKELFCEFDKDNSLESRIYDEVRGLQFDAKNKSCEFTLIPYFQKNRTAVPKRKPLKVVAKQGELLCTRNKCYRVLKVVPPQTIEGIGKLVGWIELESEPVTKKPTDPIAKIEEIPSDPKHYQ